MTGVTVIAAVTAPVEKNVTETDRVAAAVYEFADMSGRSGLVPPEDAVCPDSYPSRPPPAGRLGEGESGKTVTVDELDELRVSGDEATVEVTGTVDGRAVTDTWRPVRSDDHRRVCNQLIRSWPDPVIGGLTRQPRSGQSHRRVMSASVKPRLAGRQPSSAVGCSG